MTFKEYLKIKNKYNEKDIKLLDVSNSDLTDIYGIEEFTNIESLSIGHNNITDIEPLKYLIKLKELYMWYNKITDISCLKNSAIETLNIGYNNISDITVLYSMVNLKEVYIRSNNLNDKLKKYSIYNDYWINLNEMEELKNYLKIEHRKKLISLL